MGLLTTTDILTLTKELKLETLLTSVSKTTDSVSKVSYVVSVKCQ